MADKITMDNIIHHHTGGVIKHQTRHGNIVFPIFPRDLEQSFLDHCPSTVVHDHIQCWNSINETYLV